MKESVEEGWKKKKKYDEDCGMDHSTMKKNKLKKHMDDHHEEKEIEESVSLSKKGEYDLTADGKSSVGVRISLRFNKKQIISGSKVDGKFVMAFDPKFVKDNKLDSGAKIVKKGKWTHVAFKKADDVIAYAVLGGLSEEKEMKTFKELRDTVVDVSESKERGFIVVHVKKGKLEVKASSSYEAAQKAAKKWKLKSTAGIDAHLAD
jgi:hypothetical protein